MPAKPRPVRNKAGEIVPGVWEVVVNLPPSPHREPGKRPRRYFRVKAKTEARAALEQGRLQAQSDAGEFSTAKLTFGEIADRYLEERVRVKRAPLTYVSYRQGLHVHAATLRPIPLEKLTRWHLERFESALRSHGNTRGGGLSSSAVAQICAAVKGALNWAEEVEYLTGKNPARFWRVGAEPSPERPGLSEEQAGRLLAVLLDDPAKLPWLVLLTTNLRLSELRGLRWQDVDLDEGTYVVRQQVQLVYVPGSESAKSSTNDSSLVDTPKPGYFRPRRLPAEPGKKRGHSEDRVRPVPKSKRVRGGGFAGDVVDRLRLWQTEQKALKVAGGAYWRRQEQRYGDLLFTKANGEPLSPEHLRRVLNRLLASLGIGRRPLHALRHTWASVATRDGISPATVTRLMGHTDQRTTQGYIHLEQHEGRDAAERVFGRLSRRSGGAYGGAATDSG